MPCFQFSELFGHRKASAMAYLITCFELSTGVFWIFGELNANFGLDRKQLFFGYAGVGFYALVTGICFWPDLPYRAPPPQMVRNMAGPSPRTAGRVNRPAVVAKPLLDKPLLTQVSHLSSSDHLHPCYPFKSRLPVHLPGACSRVLFSRRRCEAHFSSLPVQICSMLNPKP
jgi:hypothetical protein